MSAIVWHIDTLTPRHFSVSKAPATVRGSASITGLTQRSASDAGRWRVKIGSLPVADADQVKAWRAIEGLVEGQLGQILLPVVDLDRAPEPLFDASPVYFSDDASFDDMSGFESGSHQAEAADYAALGATTISITTTVGDNPESGQFFSAGIRLYQIVRVTETDGTTITAKIWPPTREGITAGAELNFARPVLLCRLADDEAMALEPLDHGRWVFPDLELIEDTGPEL